MNKDLKKQEIWKTVIIDNIDTKYKVSNIGNIRNPFDKDMHPNLDTSGYYQIRIWIKRKPYSKKVHRLVAEAFIPNPENKPEVNHINGIKTDNIVENLEWCTRKENMEHAYANNLIPILYGENHGRSKYTNKQIHEVCKLLEKNKYKVKKISKMTNVDKNTINDIISRSAWNHISIIYDIPKRKPKIKYLNLGENVNNIMKSYPDIKPRFLYKKLNIDVPIGSIRYYMSKNRNKLEQTSTTIESESEIEEEVIYTWERE